MQKNVLRHQLILPDYSDQPHAALHFPDDAQRWVNYSLAAATLKNRVKGDFNLTTDEEIQELLIQNKYHIK